MKKLNKIIDLCYEYLVDTDRRPTLVGGEIEDRLRACVLEIVSLMDAAKSVPQASKQEGK